ncbi:stage II sporulation protein M [Gimesia chilikensis]|uniref:stage II sporulation protein M n=1 Tax=Gimesia chilikensis TaxID=2605989 RepID=UPI0011F04EE6|nr:stage II sporulation protein M [Gimesia chilikensis]KAA0140672.1 stage II sporulation protein M [Gimesia chilikensis]
MNKHKFIQQRRPQWKRFEEFLYGTSRKSLSKLEAEQITEFSRLLREVSHDLATIRSRGWGHDLISYLNDLVARGHNLFYGAPPSNLSVFYRYVSLEFPRLFRANIGYFLTACLLFFLPLGISWYVVQNNPSLASRVIPEEIMSRFDTMYSDHGESDPDNASEEDSESESEGRSSFGDERATMAGFYINNNVGIALKCFALGILLGIGTVYTLLFNGIFLGAVSGYVISQGHGERFLSFVISHGSFELTAIAVAGGAGLMLGNALIHPGQRTRFQSLQVRGLEAVQIAGGAAVMLVVAALIEAFWSPSDISPMLKYSVGGVLWLIVFLYLAFAGLQSDEVRESAAQPVGPEKPGELPSA